VARAHSVMTKLIAAALVLGLTGLAVSVVPSPVAAASTTSVTNCNDSGPGSFRQAIGNAGSGATIDFALSPTCATITLSSTITVGTSLTIDGPGANALMVSGNNSETVFQIDSGTTVAVSNLSIEDGSALNNGGAIYNSGDLTITDSTLSNNSADNGTGGAGGGGAIYNNDGDVTISGSDLSDNDGYGGEDGGGFGGAIDNEGGTVSISASTLSDNQALYGGAVDNGDAGTVGVGDGGGTLTISGSTLSGNNAGDGGAIDNADNGGTGTVTLTDSTLTEGSSGLEGGGGIFNDGTFAINGSDISDNVAGSPAVGGGIDNSGALEITGSTIAGNNTGEGPGGGIYDDGGTLAIADSTLSGNSSPGGAGAIENMMDSVTMTDSTVSNNDGAAGGGIANDGGTEIITSSTVSGNSAEHRGDGGGIDNTSGTVDLAATIVTDSTVGSDCSGTITDDSYNLDSDGTCGLSATHHSLSDVKPDLGPLQNNGGPTETEAPAGGSPVLNQIPVGTMGNGVTLCPGTDQRGVSRPQGTACDMGAVELTPSARAITSPSSATAVEGVSFSFTVTTAGAPLPTLTEKGKLPKRVKFIKNSNGTATISGKPKTTGVYHLTIKATFGSGATEEVAIQVFTLTVNAS
jgi:hypothetical protein